MAVHDLTAILDEKAKTKQVAEAYRAVRNAVYEVDIPTGMRVAILSLLIHEINRGVQDQLEDALDAEGAS